MVHAEVGNTESTPVSVYVCVSVSLCLLSVCLRVYFVCYFISPSVHLLWYDSIFTDYIFRFKNVKYTCFGVVSGMKYF